MNLLLVNIVKVALSVPDAPEASSFAWVVPRGIFNPCASVRFIGDWVKARRLHGNAVVEEISLTLTVRRSKTAEEVDALLAMLKGAADAAGASLRVGAGSVREAVAGERQTTAEQVLALLVARMDTVVKSADPALLEQFSVSSGEGLARGRCANSLGSSFALRVPRMPCGSATARTTA